MTWLSEIGLVMAVIGACLIAPNFVLFCPTEPVDRFAVELKRPWVIERNRQLPKGRRWHIHVEQFWTTLHRHTITYIAILWIERALIAAGALLFISGFLIQGVGQP